MKKLLLLSFFVVAVAVFSSCASNRVSCPTYANGEDVVEQKEANL